MNKISNTILQYFLGHFAELPLDKQLHFAARLWVWDRNPAARELLDGLRGNILPDGDLTHSLQGIRDGKLLPLHTGNASLNELRKPYLEKYPELRMTARILYWASLLGSVYELDSATAVDALYSRAELDTLADQLRQDQPALAMLSTHAVNFLYLHQPDQSAEFWADLANDGKLYDTADPAQRQLQQYLLTHAVIGESQFYQRPIPTEKVAAYRQLVEQAEGIIATDLQSVNLDNKLEFLVCCRLVKHVSPLEAAIIAEAEQSISPDGEYLVDRHNTNRQTGFTSFEKSEHRSVLYLMAMTEQRS